MIEILQSPIVAPVTAPMRPAQAAPRAVQAAGEDFVAASRKVGRVGAQAERYGRLPVVLADDEITTGRPGAETPEPAGSEQRGGEPIILTSFAGSRFIAQVLGQGSDESLAIELQMQHQASTSSSYAYRKAGAAPAVYSEEPAIFRLAV